MRPMLAAALLLAAWPASGGFAARAAELAYPGPVGGAAERAAESVRVRVGADRLVACDGAGAVGDQVRSGAASAGLVPVEAAGETLLTALDPGLRIERQAEHGERSWWVVTKSGGRPDDHPDHIAVNVESERGAKAVSEVVAGLLRLGFVVEQAASARLPAPGPEGRPVTRLLIVFGSDKPLLLIRATDVLARDVRAGDGHARLIGAWRQAG